MPHRICRKEAGVMAEQAQHAAKKHKLTIENRERLTATGIRKVDFCSDELITAQTELGQLNIKGQNLSIEDLSAETGDLLVRGAPSAISYTKASENSSLFSKLFK